MFPLFCHCIACTYVLFLFNQWKPKSMYFQKMNKKNINPFSFAFAQKSKFYLFLCIVSTFTMTVTFPHLRAFSPSDNGAIYVSYNTQWNIYCPSVPVQIAKLIFVRDRLATRLTPLSSSANYKLMYVVVRIKDSWCILSPFIGLIYASFRNISFYHKHHQQQEEKF